MKTNILTKKNKENDLYQETYIINDHLRISCTSKIGNCTN